jgi:ATP-dependent 26S proteasome regulatory subunit
MATDAEKQIFGDEELEDALPEEFNHMSAEAINQRGRLLDNEIRVLKDEATRLNLEQNSMKEKIKENKEKIKLNNQLPYLVGNIVEVLDIKPDEEEEDGAAVDLDSQRQVGRGGTGAKACSSSGISVWDVVTRALRGLARRQCALSRTQTCQGLLAWAAMQPTRSTTRQPNLWQPAGGSACMSAASCSRLWSCWQQPSRCSLTTWAPAALLLSVQGKSVVLKTSTRQTVFLPVVGLVDADALKPGDLVGVNKVCIVHGTTGSPAPHVPLGTARRPVAAPASHSGSVAGNMVSGG